MIFWRLVRGLIRLVIAIVVIVGIPSIIAVGAIEIGCRPESASVAAPPQATTGITDPDYPRDLANTYFTFPEWYIVYSAEDFGRFLETKSESEFPYLSQIDGFWRSFCTANRIAGGYPNVAHTKFNLYVIGLSYSFEYALKGIYENTVGRLTEWLRGPQHTPEDVYAKDVLQDYGHFLHEVPWYRYPFGDALAGLWEAAPFSSDSPARNIERHLSLSAEYAVKQGYASLITMGLAATSDPAPLKIMFVVKGDAAAILAKEADVRLVQRLPGDLTLLEAPRYERFTEFLKRLAAERVQIVDIAGNRRILVSVIAPEDANPPIPGANRLFSLPIDARPGFRRVGYDADVAALPAIIDGFRGAGIEVEHFYDY